MTRRRKGMLAGLIVLLAVTAVLGRRRAKIWLRKPLPPIAAVPAPKLIPGAPTDFPSVVEVVPSGPDAVEQVLRQLEEEGRTYTADSLRDWVEIMVREHAPGDTVFVARVQLSGPRDCAREEARGNCPYFALNRKVYFFPDGYFVGLLGNWHEAYELRGDGLEPTDIRLTEAPAALAWLGTIPVADLAPKDRASFKTQLVLDGVKAEDVKVTFAPRARDNSSDPRLEGGFTPLVTTGFRPEALPPEPQITVSEDGALTVEGLAPMEYDVSLEAPGCVTHNGRLRFTRGQNVDEGTLPLEKLLTLTIDYLTSPDAGFLMSDPESTQMRGDQHFVAGPETDAGWDFRLWQHRGEFNLGDAVERPDNSAADLGLGTLESFRAVDVRRLALHPAHGLPLTRGHVYLLSSHRQRWILFRIPTEAPTARAP